MKIWEILKEENVDKKYKVTNVGVFNPNEIWEVRKEFCSGDIDLVNQNNDLIISKIELYGLFQLDFEEVVDWSKVKVDTKVLVSHYGEEWCKRHFAKYEDGKIYCFNGGGTSWTRGKCIRSLTDWKYAKIWQEGEE